MEKISLQAIIDNPLASDAQRKEAVELLAGLSAPAPAPPTGQNVVLRGSRPVFNHGTKTFDNVECQPLVVSSEYAAELRSTTQSAGDAISTAWIALVLGKFDLDCQADETKASILRAELESKFPAADLETPDCYLLDGTKRSAA